MNTTDPIETTLTFDHTENTVMGWTNHDPTIRAWKRDFTDYVTVTTRRVSNQRKEDICELRIPLEYVQASNKLKRRTVQVSEENKERSRERLRLARLAKEKTA